MSKYAENQYNYTDLEYFTFDLYALHFCRFLPYFYLFCHIFVTHKEDSRFFQ